MGLKKYEQEIAAAPAHPDREHAVTVLESLARSLRRHEWPAERRAAAYDLATRAAEEARQLTAATTPGPSRAEQLFEAARREQPHSSAAGWGDLTPAQRAYWQQIADQDIAAAQEIANREGMAVHVGCGGEVTIGFGDWKICEACDATVTDADVVWPG